MEKIEENSHNCLEQKEQLFCLLWICQPVEIKAFQQDHSLLALAGCFQSSFVRFPAITSSLSTVGGRSHLTDRSLAWESNYHSETHLYKNTKELGETLSEMAQSTIDASLTNPRLILGRPA